MGSSLLSEVGPETFRALQSVVREAYGDPLARSPQIGQDRVRRDISTSTGLTFYDLETPAKLIQPFTCVLEPMTPHVPGRGDIATHWRTITGVNTTNLEGGVPEGIRSARITDTGEAQFASYATIGLEDDVTEEGWEAGMGLEDLRARMALDLLYAGKVSLERMLTSGNGPTAAAGGIGGVALGTPSAPTLATATTGGTIAASEQVWIGVVCLSRSGQVLSAVSSVSVAGGVPRVLSQTSPVGETYSYNGGSSNGSATANVTTGSGTATNTVSATLGTIPAGTVAFAWFASIHSGSASHQYIAQITTINSAIFTSLPVTPPAAATGYANDLAVLVADGHGDCSQNAYAFTGMLPLAAGSGTVSTLATGTPGTGTTLTSNGGAGIVEIDHVLRAQFEATQTAPDLMLISAQEADTINTLVFQNGGTPLVRFNIDGNAANGGVTAPAAIGTYFNKFTTDGSGALIKVQLSPHVPHGTIMLITSRVPGSFYPGNNMGNLWELHDRRPWYQQEWPPRTRAYESGVYTSLTLAHYFPQTLSLITNIAGIAGH